MEEIIVKVNKEGVDKKIIYIAIAVVVVIAIGAALYFFDLIPSGILKKVMPEKPRVIEENLVIPNTQSINGADGRLGGGGNVQTPLVPKSEGEKIIVTKAMLTARGSYELAAPEAQKWSVDARPSLVKSLGAVTLDGKSSQWQLSFSSATKKDKGYEIIIQADKIVSQKELDSTAAGANLPDNLRDSGEAIIGLQELPQYSDATISEIILYYNTDIKAWRYTLTTSRGVTSTKAQ